MTCTLHACHQLLAQNIAYNHSPVDPVHLQWPGVFTLCAEEEEEADAGFKAAGRSSAGLVELQLCGLEFAVRCGRR